MKNELSRKMAVCVIIALFVGASVLPNISGSTNTLARTQHMLNKENKKQKSDQIETTTQGELMVMSEIVSVYPDGSCWLHLEIQVKESPLSRGYRESLGYNVTMGGYQPIPENKSYNSSLTLGENVTEYELDVQGSVPVRKPFLDALIQEHRLSLGIDIIYESIEAWMWESGGDFWVSVEAVGYMQAEYSDGSWEIVIGPKDLNASYARSGFLFTKIGFIQHMLNSSDFEGIQSYLCEWTIEFTLPAPLTNLLDEDWDVDFGPEHHPTYLYAAVYGLPGLPTVVLTEIFEVSNETITATELELLEDDLLCYKIFIIEYELFSYETSFSESALSRGLGDWSLRWNIHVWAGRFLLGFEDANFVAGLIVTANLELEGYIGCDFKWFRMRKFGAWMKLKPTLKVNITANASAHVSKEWRMNVFEFDIWDFCFWIGPVPIWGGLTFDADVRLKVTTDAWAGFTWEVAAASAYVKAGIGWKRGRGWYGIFETDMDISRIGENAPETSSGLEVTIRPSVGFRLTLLFYDTVGPFVELEPYVLLGIKNTLWWILVGISVNTGIAFEDWFKKLIRLRDFEWTLVDIVLWQYPYPDHDEDVMVTEVRGPKQGFVGDDNVTFWVDVLNIGQNPVSGGDLILRYGDGDQWEEIDSKPIGSLNVREWVTLNFTWDTTGIPDGDYIINATVFVDGDDNASNDYNTSEFRLDIQDVAVENVSAWPTVVVAGANVTINVTVRNEGTANISSLPVFAYYEDLGGCGDCNGDDIINVGDVVYLITYLYRGGSPPEPLCVGDVNNDDIVNVGDVVYLITYLYRGGPPPDPDCCGGEKQYISDVWCECMRMFFDLPPDESRLLRPYKWDTFGIDPGDYLISAEANRLPYEADADTADNNLDDGVVTVLSP
jgi:hypothetical protein